VRLSGHVAPVLRNQQRVNGEVLKKSSSMSPTFCSPD